MEDIEQEPNQVKKFKCDVCNDELKHHQSLFKHKKAHSRRNVVVVDCKVCLKTFSGEDALTRHLMLGRCNGPNPNPNPNPKSCTEKKHFIIYKEMAKVLYCYQSSIVYPFVNWEA